MFLGSHTRSGAAIAQPQGSRTQHFTGNSPKTPRLARAGNDPALSSAAFLKAEGGTFSSSAGNLSLKPGKALRMEGRAKLTLPQVCAPPREQIQV